MTHDNKLGITCEKNTKPGVSTSVEFALLLSASTKAGLLITPTLGQHQDEV